MVMLANPSSTKNGVRSAVCPIGLPTILGTLPAANQAAMTNAEKRGRTEKEAWAVPIGIAASPTLVIAVPTAWSAIVSPANAFTK